MEISLLKCNPNLNIYIKKNKFFQNNKNYSSYNICPAFAYMITYIEDMEFIKKNMRLLNLNNNNIKYYSQYFTELLITYTNNEILDIWEQLYPGEISTFLEYMGDDLLWIFKEREIYNLLYLIKNYKFSYWKDKNSFEFINLFFQKNKQIFLEIINYDNICYTNIFNIDKLLTCIYKIKKLDILKIFIKQVNDISNNNHYLQKKILIISLINNNKSFINYYLSNFNEKIYYNLDLLYFLTYSDFIPHYNKYNKYIYIQPYKNTQKNISDNLLLIYNKLKQFHSLEVITNFILNKFSFAYHGNFICGFIRFHSTNIFKDIIKIKGYNFIDTIFKTDYVLKNFLQYGNYSLLKYFDSIEYGKYIKKNILENPILIDISFFNSDDRIMKYVFRVFEERNKNFDIYYTFLNNNKISTSTKLRKIKIILNKNLKNIDLNLIEVNLVNNNSYLINKWIIAKFYNNNLTNSRTSSTILHHYFISNDLDKINEIFNKLYIHFNYCEILCLLIKHNFKYYYMDYIFYKIYFKLKKLNNIDKKNILKSIKNIYYEYELTDKYLKFYDKILKIIKLCNIDLNSYESNISYYFDSLLNYNKKDLFKIGILNGISFPKLYKDSFNKHNFTYYFEYKDLKPFKCLYKLILSLQFKKKFRNKKLHKNLYNNTEVNIKSRPPIDKVPVLKKGGNLFYNDFNEIMYLTNTDKKSQYINPNHIQPIELLNIIKNEIIITPKIDGEVKKNFDKDLVFPPLSDHYEYFNLDAEYIKELDLYLVFGIRNNSSNHDCIFNDYLDLKSMHDYASKTDNDFYIKYNSKKTIKQKIFDEFKAISDFHKQYKECGSLWWPKKFWRIFDTDIILDVLETFQELEEEMFRECKFNKSMLSHIKNGFFKTDGLIINIPNNKNIIYKLKPKREMTIDLMFDETWKDNNGNTYSISNNKENYGIYRCYFEKNKWVAVDYRPNKKYPNSSNIVKMIMDYHQNPWNLNDIKKYNNLQYYQIKDNYKLSNITNSNIIRNRWFSKHIKNNYKILDLGCGFFINYLWNNKTLTIDGMDNDLQLINNYKNIENKEHNNFYIQDIKEPWNLFDDNIKKKYNTSYIEKEYDIILLSFSIHNCFIDNGFTNIMNEINKRSNSYTKIMVRMIDKNTLFWSKDRVELPDNGFIELIKDYKEISNIMYFFPWKHKNIIREPILSFIQLAEYMRDFGWILSEDFSYIDNTPTKYYNELNKSTKNLMFTKKFTL